MTSFLLETSWFSPGCGVNASYIPAERGDLSTSSVTSSGRIAWSCRACSSVNGIACNSSPAVSKSCCLQRSTISSKVWVCWVVCVVCAIFGGLGGLGVGCFVL